MMLAAAALIAKAAVVSEAPAWIVRSREDL